MIEVTVSGMTFTFRRGFVAAITCDAESFLANADALLAINPIEEVTLTTWPPVSWMAERWAAATAWLTRHQVADCNLARNALRDEWPQVKAWRLPPEGSNG